MVQTGLVYFRNTDLRIKDNYVIKEAYENNDKVVNVFIYDENEFSPESNIYQYSDLPKLDIRQTGYHRAKFLIESVNNLRLNLQSLGSDIIIRYGDPVDILSMLVDKYEVCSIYCHSGEAYNEKLQIQKIEERLKDRVVLNKIWGNTLIDISKLPFSIDKFPKSATEFRNIVEKNCKIPRPIECQHLIKKTPTQIDEQAVDITLTTIGFKLPRTVTTKEYIIGGEVYGQARMQDYIWDKDCLKEYFLTRNQLEGDYFSSKLSPWISTGCISVRDIVYNIIEYEASRKKNKSTYWMIVELMFRDYFRFYAEHYGRRIFGVNGIKDNEKIFWKIDNVLFNKWSTGKTKNLFINAIMRELNTTGFISNRSRQITASYLTKNLRLDWRLGALFFESKLIDYDPCQNWGNWNYSAGVGSDQRENRYFSISRQVEKYDPKLEYIRKWVSESKFMNNDQIIRTLSM